MTVELKCFPHRVRQLAQHIAISDSRNISFRGQQKANLTSINAYNLGSYHGWIVIREPRCTTPSESPMIRILGLAPIERIRG